MAAVRVQPGTGAVPGDGERLDRAGLEIVDLDVSRTSLEEVFVELTDAGHGGLDDGEGEETDGTERERRAAEAPTTDGGR